MSHGCNLSACGHGCVHGSGEDPKMVVHLWIDNVHMYDCQERFGRVQRKSLKGFKVSRDLFLSNFFL